ncbi:GNAT family N-acetyltransferase [Methanolobus vulcani]|uniref:GNAT family N-acetyltransferase n=1 Tax=Methanolobus vulcani TaxID=38026 RepID=A0A7Z8KMV4_9EURY|nr:GNAT family protein [Methanolobus vulcani]TQD25027.1 GNAT family N-acetyltransferase [Methanolobus vulcani]
MKRKWNCGNIVYSYCTEADLSDIASMLAKQNVCEYLFFGPNKEEDTLAYFSPLINSISESLKANNIPDMHVFTIREKDSGVFIGQCALLPIEFTNGNYLIGYQIDDTQWRKGYGSAACEFLTYFAFSVLSAFRITGDCAEGNIGSEKTMIKAGFKPEGQQKRYWSKNGKWHDRLLFGLTTEDISEEKLEILRSKYD